MARFGLALSLLLATTGTATVDGYSNFTPVSRQLQRGAGERHRRGTGNFLKNLSHGTPRGVSAANADFGGSSGGDSISEALNSVTSAARDSIAKAVSDEPDLYEAQIAKKKKIVQDRLKVYRVTLPLISSSLEEKSSLLSMGVKVRQVEKGRTMGTTELNLDTLAYETNTATTEIDSGDKNVEYIDDFSFIRRIDGEFQGVVVSYVDKESAAWAAGVRPGDVLKSSSATMGNQMWPKSTLEGVQSALSSRKVSSGVVQFEFQRLGEVVDNQFELTLTRPIGLELKETRDGFVEVAGFTSTAPTLVRYAVKVGDRVLAVDSSIGEKMWPVSTVEGVISAVTARLPGQQVTFRFERPLENMGRERVKVAAEAVLEETSSASGSMAKIPQELLLRRCQEILKRYAADARKTDKFVNKYAVRGMVADKVLDALQSAQVKVDEGTLSMLMCAYLACGQPGKAISTFEAAAGLDSFSLGLMDHGKSSDDVTSSGLTTNINALDIYTASSLLKAHAMRNDLKSVKRVWAAIVKDCGSVVAAATPTDAVADIQTEKLKKPVVPDTCFYNIAMAAAIDAVSTKDEYDSGLDFAMEIFESMEQPKATYGTAPRRDVISYNTAINILTKRGHYKEALDLLFQMKMDRVRPDKFSYTSLVEAVASTSDDDLEELLYDMREQGVTVDVVVYNSIIKCFCEQRRLMPAKRMVNEMEAAGLSPDSRTYGLLMKGLIDVGKPGAALTLFESACADQNTVVVTENHHLYTTAIKASAAVGDHQRALELLSRMNAVGVKPTLKTMTALIGACLSAGQASLAVDIYNRISEPDGFAITQGIRALALSGDGEQALALLRSVENNMSGKQIMYAQQTIIESSLRSGDYDVARKAVEELLRRGHILSKAMYQSMFDILQLFPSSRRDIPKLIVGDAEKEKFKFLLFVLDSISKRNLPCEGPLYSAILSYALRLGALPKKIATLLASAKNANDDGVETKNDIMDGRAVGDKALTSWEELYVLYDELKSKIIGPEVLPQLTVRFGRRDLPKILRAEQGLTYASSSKSKIRR